MHYIELVSTFHKGDRIVLCKLAVHNKLFYQVGLCFPKALNILSERILAKLFIVFLLEIIYFFKRILAKLIAPCLLELIKEVLGRLLSIEFCLKRDGSIAHYVNSAGKYNIVNNGDKQRPCNICVGVDINIDINLLRKCRGKLDLQASHFSAFTDIHFKFSADLQRNLESVFKMAVLAIARCNVESNFNIIAKLKGMTGTVCF